jgi:putative transposase
MDHRARRQLERPAASLETEHRGAAASIREGLEEQEIRTLESVGIGDAPYRMLRTRSPIENLNGSDDYRHHVKCS